MGSVGDPVEVVEVEVPTFPEEERRVPEPRREREREPVPA